MGKDLDTQEIENAYKIIGSNVKRIRKEKGYTQLQLSLAIGHHSVSVISCAEIYHNKHHFNIEHLLKISKVLNVPVSSFFEGV